MAPRSYCTRGILIAVALMCASTLGGCAIFNSVSERVSARESGDASGARARTPGRFLAAETPPENESLGTFFYDGNAFAGDLQGPKSDPCEIAADKKFNPDGTATLTLQISGKPFTDAFVKKYLKQIKLDESGKAIVFVTKAELPMQHNGPNHLFKLPSEKGSDGESPLQLQLRFEPIVAGGYRLKEFQVSAEKKDPVICNDLAVVR